VGWKNVKEHYRIGHIVQVTNEGICIGSGYISDIIVIDPSTGSLTKRYDRGNDELSRYQSELEADPETLRRLIATPDRFAKAVPVYTFAGADIIEVLCEEPGWPNVTHDGSIMYANTFSPDRKQVILWAKQNADTAVRYGKRAVAEAELTLRALQLKQAEDEAILAKLEANYFTTGLTE
jgi:hypothetical protein